MIGDLPEAEVSSDDDVVPQHVPTPDFDHPPDADDPWAGEPEHSTDGAFDAFDDSTWYFEPAPAPWYQRKQALTAIIATTAAAIAIVVSGVLLVFRGSTDTVESTTSVTPTAPSTVASSPSQTSPQPPPPPPPPPESSAGPVGPPAQTYEPRSPRSSKGPEIGVTRTPVTRSQLSVAPQRPGGRGTPH